MRTKRGRCPFYVTEGDDPFAVCGRPLEMADEVLDEWRVGVWRCSEGHMVAEVEGTDTEK